MMIIVVQFDPVKDLYLEFHVISIKYTTHTS
jgi:hypothetical protein